MKTDRDVNATYSCPRCGGPMYKPANSKYFWHASNNHPPCSITNVAEMPAKTPTTEGSTEETKDQQ